MGFSEEGKLAICIRRWILVIFIGSLWMLYHSFSLIHQPSLCPRLHSFSEPLQMQDWIQKTKPFYLKILRFRPLPTGGFELSLKGQYVNFVEWITRLKNEHPELIWQRIIMEQKGNALRIHLEVKS